MSQSNVIAFPNPHQVAAAVAKKPVQPYNMDPKFEAAFITACCCRPRLFAKVREFIEVDGFDSAPGKLAWGALERLFKETSTTPGSLLIVIQRLRADFVSGKLTEKDLEGVNDMFDAAEDKGLPTDDEILAVAAPMLTRRVEREALEESFIEFSKAGDISKPMERVTRARNMGKIEARGSIARDDKTRAEMIRRANLPRLPTGILELDDALKGGPKKGTAAMFLGPSSAGKSMALVQVAAAAVVRSFNVAYASLELLKDDVMNRYIANMTGFPVDGAMLDPAWNAFDRLDMEHAMGVFRIEQFTPKLTTVRDIVSWVEAEQTELGVEFDLLVIDYGDKLGSGSKRADEGDTGYVAQGTVYDQMFTWARDNEKWLWTASQTVRDSDNSGKKAKKIRMDDTADSMGKVRNFDLVIGLNPRDEYTLMLFGIEKNRNGGNRGAEVGPLPVDFACARVAPPMFPPKKLIIP